MSLSRAIGEWLGDTVEAAEFMATKMEQARAAPGIVMREMHAYALGLADETNALMNKIKDEGAASRTSGQAQLARTAAKLTPSPPSSNTGGKGHKNHSEQPISSKARTLKTSEKGSAKGNS